MESSLTELLLPGLKLRVTGMGIVFLFLALLVWIIGITAKLVQSVNPQPEQTRRAGLPVETNEAEVVAVIAAALQQRQHP